MEELKKDTSEQEYVEQVSNDSENSTNEKEEVKAENSQQVDEETLKKQKELEKEYLDKLKKYQQYQNVMRIFAFVLCFAAVIACLIGGICVIVLESGAGAIVAGVIMLVLAPIIAFMLFSMLYVEKHPDKFKAYINKRAKKMREQQVKRESKKKEKK